MNMVPCGYHRYYYMKQAMLEHAIEEFNEGGTRAEQMKQVEHELFEIYKNAELMKNQNNLGGGAILQRCSLRMYPCNLCK